MCLLEPRNNDCQVARGRAIFSTGYILVKSTLQKIPSPSPPPLSSSLATPSAILRAEKRKSRELSRVEIESGLILAMRALGLILSQLLRQLSSSNHSTKKPVTTMLTYPWKCTVLHCNHLGNTWKPLVLMTRHFDYCPSASEGDNQSVRSSVLGHQHQWFPGVSQVVTM